MGTLRRAAGERPPAQLGARRETVTPSGIRRVLVAMDGSPHGEAAAGLGIDWARRFGAELLGLGILDGAEGGPGARARRGVTSPRSPWRGPSRLQP
ncbi:MAG: hypothetical protein DMD79_01280 [Candidatus Rokuibacteriota bacterium]|nr:MAG: hypothetical protein DMD79_01280 [Candidatus Rokubacteria bacterium]